MNADADSAEMSPEALARDELRRWLIATGAGDRSAFEALYARTSSKLFGVCLRILSERSEAEEALQDAYIAVWRRAGSFDGSKSSPITWLVMVARNKAIDRLRASPPRSLPLELADDIADERGDAALAADASIARQRLQRCLEALEARQRQVIRTAFFEGSTYDEIATRSGTPLGTIKSWVRRGLIQLKACLQQ